MLRSYPPCSPVAPSLSSKQRVNGSSPTDRGTRFPDTRSRSRANPSVACRVRSGLRESERSSAESSGFPCRPVRLCGPVAYLRERGVRRVEVGSGSVQRGREKGISVDSLALRGETVENRRAPSAQNLLVALVPARDRPVALLIAERKEFRQVRSELFDRDRPAAIDPVAPVDDRVVAVEIVARLDVERARSARRCRSRD